MKIPLKPGVEYSDLSDNAKQGLEILQKALDKPEVQRANHALGIWVETLTDEQRHWLRYTEEGRKEMWRRIGLSQNLYAALTKRTPT